MEALTPAHAQALHAQAEALLTFGCQGLVDGQGPLLAALAISPDTAKELYKSKKSAEARVVRFTLKAFEALSGLREALIEAGLDMASWEQPQPKKNAKDKKLSQPSGALVGLLQPPQPAAEEPAAAQGLAQLPLATLSPIKTKKSRQAQAKALAATSKAAAAHLKTVGPAFLAAAWAAPEVVQARVIYRALARLFFRSLPTFLIATLLWAGLAGLLISVLNPRISARAIFWVLSRIPDLLWFLVQEFSDELRQQIFGPDHCPDSCYGAQFGLPGNRNDSIRQRNRAPARHPPYQPPQFLLTVGTSVITGIVLRFIPSPSGHH